MTQIQTNMRRWHRSAPAVGERQLPAGLGNAEVDLPEREASGQRMYYVCQKSVLPQPKRGVLGEELIWKSAGGGVSTLPLGWPRGAVQRP